MKPNEQEQRSSAAKEFQESLDQLQNLLEENHTEEQLAQESEISENKNPKNQVAEDSVGFYLTDWEEAVADIDKYFEGKNQQD